MKNSTIGPPSKRPSPATRMSRNTKEKISPSASRRTEDTDSDVQNSITLQGSSLNNISGDCGEVQPSSSRSSSRSPRSWNFQKEEVDANNTVISPHQSIQTSVHEPKHSPLDDNSGSSKKRTIVNHSPRSAAQDEDALDPISVGDMLLLKTASSSDALPGLLVGDSAFGRMGVQVQADAQGPAQLNIGDCVFRVCPMLSYRQRHELEVAEAAAKTATLREGDKQLRALTLLRNRVAAEEKRNARVMEGVVAGSYNGGNTSVVKYGEIVQLQHVSSNSFVSALQGAASFDPECRAVELHEDGSSAALFKFMPRYKAQTIGSIVYYSHSVVLESAKQRGMTLHTSRVAYSDIPSLENASLPKCLKTGVTLETNLAPESESETYTVAKFARFGPKDASLLKTSVPFRLYHSQSESFVHASCAQKDIAQLEGRKDDSMEASFRCHIPYLKQLPEMGETADPTDPAHHSAKGVWCFEPLKRTMACTLAWDVPCRVRHVPSGRYLCVDAEAQFRPPGSPTNISEDEVWYPAYLIDDENSPGKKSGDKTSATTAPANWMTFTVSSADVKTSDGIPDADVSLRLEHAIGGGRRVYLHNTEKPKPQRPGKDQVTEFASTTGIVFSTVRSSQDVVKLLRVNDQEVQAIRISKSFLVPTAVYLVGVANPSTSLQSGILVKEAIFMLLKIIGMQIKGGLHGMPPPGEEWIQLANDTLPAAFSAKFGGARDPFVQHVFRDTKLIDAVFAMGTALYTRKKASFRYAGEVQEEEQLPLRAVQKLVHVALQKLMEGEAASQDYFGRRVSNGQTSWMQTIMGQLEDPLGAAVTLSKLLGANERLMARYAESGLVLQFANMVRNLGPQPRLLNFFGAICSTGGKKPVKTNQEMVLRLTWMNENFRKKVYVSHTVFPGLKLPDYGNVVDPSGAVCAKHDAEAIKANKPPKDYLGKAVYESEEGLPAVFVQWSSSEVWTPCIDELFWGPSKFRIPTYDLSPNRLGAPSKEVWVRIEDLCWVQDPHRLCEAVTGKKYANIFKDAETDPELAAALKAQEQFVDYYVEQILLFSKMCFGRNYNVISHLSQQFSYEMLASMCYNPYLPPRVRSASCLLVQNLYLDRFPQVHNCGRPVLPELLWVYKPSADSKNMATAIKAVTLREIGSLPEFGITKDHPFHEHPDPLYGFPTSFKYFLLRNFGNIYLSGLFGVISKIVTLRVCSGELFI